MIRKETGAIAVIFFTCLLLYLPTLDDDFISDDFYFINHPNLSFVVESLTTFGFFRPLVRLSFVLDAYLWGTSPAGYHVTNLLLHFFAGLSVFLFCRALKMMFGASLLSALLFTAHPAGVESVAWLSGRSEILSTLFFLLSLLFFLQSGEQSEKRFYALGALACLIIGFSAKETAVMAAPAALALCYINPPAQRPRRKNAALLAAFWILTAGFVLFRYLFFTNTAFWDKMLSPQIVKKLPALLSLLFGSHTLMIYGLFAAMLLLFFLLARRLRFTLVMLILFVLPLVPNLIYGFSRARYLYLPSAFLSILIGAAVWEITKINFKQRRAVTYALAGALFISFVIATTSKLPAWEAAGGQYRQMATRLAEAAKHRAGRTIYYFGAPRMAGDTGLLFIGLDRAAAFASGGRASDFKPLGPGAIENICAGTGDIQTIGAVVQWTQGRFINREDLIPLILEMSADRGERRPPLCAFPDGGEIPQGRSEENQNRIFYREKLLNPFRAAVLRIETQAMDRDVSFQGEIRWTGTGGRPGGRIRFDHPSDGTHRDCVIELYRHPSWVATGRVEQVEVSCPVPIRLRKICFSSIMKRPVEKNKKPEKDRRRKGW